MSEEELERKAAGTLDEYVQSQDLDEVCCVSSVYPPVSVFLSATRVRKACTCMSEILSPESAQIVLVYLLNLVFERKDDHREVR